jgi:hypothetical protein
MKHVPAVAMIALAATASLAAVSTACSAQVTAETYPEQIRATMRAELPAVRRCYEQQLASHPNLAGTLVVSFRIDAAGQIDGAPQTEGMSEPPELSRCVADTVGGLHFAAPPSGALSVRYPFSFHP